MKIHPHSHTHDRTENIKNYSFIFSFLVLCSRIGLKGLMMYLLFCTAINHHLVSDYLHFSTWIHNSKKSEENSLEILASMFMHDHNSKQYSELKILWLTRHFLSIKWTNLRDKLDNLHTVLLAAGEEIKLLSLAKKILNCHCKGETK